MAALAVRSLSKSYGGVRALAGVSFSVAAGEMVAMIGPNGAGKTTCFNVLNGQIAPDSGDALLDGASLLGRAPHHVARLGVGRTFQVAATFDSMTVDENVQVALAACGRTEQTGTILARVGMEGQGDTACAALAYGELKRVELAMVLAQRPRLLLMDEPTAGMAPEERDSLMTLAASLARSENIAVLFTEHDMDAVFGFADRVIALHLGALIAEGAPAEVRANARLREVYLGDA
jgi:branched-chain amino acid transport system ATP-binding protein